MSEKQARFLEILEKKYGNISATCKALGLSRSNFYDWKKDSEEFRIAVHDVEEAFIDNSESKLHELVNGVLVEGTDEENPVYQKPPDFRAIQFHLATKGKHRGYTEKIEMETNQNNTITVKIDYGDGITGE